MKRKIYDKLIEWKNSTTRQPLLVLGARQVGKTYILNVFGKENYVNVVYCNLENEQDTATIFNGNIDPKTIIKKIEQIKNTKILPGTTLLILDEIQSSPRALTSLKYFKEQGNEYHVIGSGSLLGVAMNKGGYSFPVGCVSTLNLYPLDFEEFLWANNQNGLIELINASYQNNSYLSEPIHNIALEWYKKYLYIGGMPRAVSTYIITNNYQLVRDEQKAIIDNYIYDMAKYSTPINANKAYLIFNNVAVQLAKENTKFKYSLIKRGSRAKEYELALNWICEADMTSQVFRISQGKFPLNTNQVLSDFKLYLNDVGLLCALYDTTPDQVLSEVNVLNEFKGGLTENYVFNQLRVNGFTPYYWTSNREAEVDFVLQKGSDIIPIEVKSNTNNHTPSLKLFVDLYKPKYSIKVSTKNFGFENNIKSLPLYSLFLLKNENN